MKKMKIILIPVFLLFLSGCNNPGALIGAAAGGLSAGPLGLAGGALAGETLGRAIAGKPIFDSSDSYKSKPITASEPSPAPAPVIKPAEPEPAKKDDSVQIKELEQVF
ncbi:MAG: hypothetical protein Q8N58_02500 [bacterium]|nr:hypothetical protein [bacterium]